MSINDFKEKINRFVSNVNEDVIIVFIIILVALASFGLGRLSVIEENRQPIILENVASVSSSLKDHEISDVSGGVVVASKNGTKYHYPWCSGAQRIKESNKIQFNSIEEAEKAGYTPAANCKGL